MVFLDDVSHRHTVTPTSGTLTMATRLMNVVQKADQRGVRNRRASRRQAGRGVSAHAQPQQEKRENRPSPETNGFHAILASASKACLACSDHNRYSVYTSAVGRLVKVRAYAKRIELRQDGHPLDSVAATEQNKEVSRNIDATQPAYARIIDIACLGAG